MSSILKISEAATLGLHTMALLAARPDQVLSTKSIADELEVSEAHLSKVLQRLTKVGLVRSTRGARGGFSITKRAQDIPLLEVYEAIDGRLDTSTCLLGHRACVGKSCILGDLLENVNQQVAEHFSGRTLSELAEAFRTGDS